MTSFNHLFYDTSPTFVLFEPIYEPYDDFGNVKVSVLPRANRLTFYYLTEPRFSLTLLRVKSKAGRSISHAE